jgi:hypothetical protein
MIIFELMCDQAHEFEGWFPDHAAFQEQVDKALLQCPICGSIAVSQRLSTGGRIRSDNQENPKTNANSLIQALREVVETHFEDTGSDFAKRALKMHYGVEERKNIRGTSTLAEEKMLKEEGVKFFKIPMIEGNSKLH